MIYYIIYILYYIYYIIYVIIDILSLGAHAPSKPDIVVRGRNELHISWRPPEMPLGRFFRYDLVMNSEVIYSGTGQHFVARRLKPDKEYIVQVCR